MNERVKNSARNMIAATIYRVLNLVFPFFINAIIIQTLGVEYLGLNMLFASILQVLSLTELGFGAVLVFSMYEPIAKNDMAKVSALLSLYRKVYFIMGAVIVVLGLACIPVLPNIISGEVPEDINIYILFIISLANCVFPYFFFGYRTSLFYANQRKDISEIINTVIEIAMNISKIVILLITKDYYLFCSLQLVYSVINGVTVWYISKRMYPKYRCEGDISKTEKKAIFSRVIGLSINKLCWVLSNSLDSVVISGFLGLVILGQYNNYFVITNALICFLCIIPASATSSIGNSMVCESVEKNFEDFKLFQFGFSILLGWASVSLLCLVQPFTRLWLGEDLMFDNVTAVIFPIYLYSILSSIIFMTYREAAGIWMGDRIRPFIEGGLNLVLNIILVQLIGVKGVMISTVITMGIIRTVWGSAYLFKEYFKGYSHGKYLLRLLHYLIITVAVGVLTYWICGYIEMDTVMGLVLKGILCIIIPGLLYLFVYYRSKEFKKGVLFVRGILFNRNKRR